MAQNRIVVPVPAPRNFQWPWREIAFAAIVLIAAGILVYSGVNWVASRASENTNAPAVPAVLQPVAQPVQQAPQAPAAVAPAVVLLALRWGEYDWEKNPLGLGEYYAWGKDENGVLRGGGEDFRQAEFVGTGITKDAIVYIKSGISGRSEVEPLQFSPDNTHWYQVVNLPEVPSGWAQIRGAVWDGDDILIIANYQYEPWKYKGYVARATPEDMKRASQ